MKQTYKNKPNVIFLVIDSARSYSTGGLDDRDKLEMMERFADESVYFSTAVSSAPSSLMSASATLTSLPAYYIARNYDDFKYDDQVFISLPRLLEAEGYEIKSCMNALETREKFDTLLPHIEAKYWPDDIQHDQVRWPNERVTDVLDNYLADRDDPRPLFMWIWYNIRLDPNTSNEVERGISVLKSHGVYENAVFILCSDHGYIDPRRGYTPEKLKEMGLTHDLVMTEDNIRIPLYIRYPGSPVKKVETLVSTLDLTPTILNLLEIPYPEDAPTRMHGLDLKPLIDSEIVPASFKHRKLRCDARFFAQADRTTVLRGIRYKYLIRPEMGIEEFYEPDQDEWEANNLIEDPNLADIVADFRASYRDSETDAMQFQTRFMLRKLQKTLDGSFRRRRGRVIVVGLGQPYYLDNVSAILPQALGNMEFDLIVADETSRSMSELSRYRQVFTYHIEDERLVWTENRRPPPTQYDLKLELGDKRTVSTYPLQQSLITDTLKAKKSIAIDPNMKATARETAHGDWRFLMRAAYKKRGYYWRHPSIFIRHAQYGLTRLLARATTNS